MAVTHPIETCRLARTHQIAGGLLLGRRDVDRLEQPALEQAGELARVARVGLDVIAGPLRHEPGRDHLTLQPALDEIPVQPKARGTRLVAAAHVRPLAQHPSDRLLLVGQRPLAEQLVRTHRRQPDRARVHVQANGYRRRLVHGRRPPYVALPGHSRQPTTYA